jgi:hypothetical protein
MHRLGGMLMKTDLNSIKAELKRLADVDYLKKELNRLAKDIKNFDLSQSLTPQAKARVEKLEKRFRALKVTLQEIQSKADKTFEKFAALVGRSKKAAKSSRGSQKSAGKTTGNSGAKASGKSAARAADQKSEKRSEKTSAKKASTKKASSSKKQKSADV